MTKQIYIVDLKVNYKKNNGVLYCSAIDAETNERIIHADLKYIMTQAQEKGWEILDAQDLLAKIALNFKIYGNGNPY